MTTATITTPEPAAPPAPPPAPADGPRPLRWTREEYYRLAEQGYFKGRRVMLIEGEILVMAGMNANHANGLLYALQVIHAAFGPTFTIRPQLPLDLGQASEPEPDIAVIAGPLRSQPPGHPTTAALIVEVADSSLAYNLGDKASLYAAAGISDYWVLDIPNRRLHVFRDPRPDPAAAHGHSYFHHIINGPTDTIAPLAAPQSAVAVADLLP